MVLLVLACSAARAAEPVTRIFIHVEPFYSARSAEEPPKVATGRPHAELLGSQNPEDILKARDGIVAEPKLVTPMTMMVLAIRLYDIGQRDEAVFWFYAAKDRFVSLMEVALPNASQLQIATDAMKAFSALAGPIINGYAFCDIAKQQAARSKAIAWVETNPYAVIFDDRIPARNMDRKVALEAAMMLIKDGAAKERAYFEDAKNAARFAASRKQNEADGKYCWK